MLLFACAEIPFQESIYYLKAKLNIFSFSILLAVKPTVTLPADDSPQLSQQESEGTLEPTGDLAELSQNVGLTAGRPATTSQKESNTRKTNKNKGVGKGCSWSSGPPPKRRHPAIWYSNQLVVKVILKKT